MLIGVDLDGLALAAGNFDRDDFLGEVTGGDRLAGALLRADGKGVLIGARYLEIRRHVLAGLRHGVDAVLLLHQRVDEAPADGGVEDFGMAREGFLRLALHEGRPRHRFDATGNGKFHFAGTDGAGGGADRLQARGAEPVQGDAGNALRQTRQEQRHARDIAVVLTGLVGAAVKDFFELVPIDLRVARHQCLDRHGGEIVGAHLGERTAKAADRSANGIAEIYVAHFSLFLYAAA